MDTETVGDPAPAPLGEGSPSGTDGDVADLDGLGAACGDGVPGWSEVDEQPATSTSAATTSDLTARP
jgi:hypothetical protein